MKKIPIKQSVLLLCVFMFSCHSLFAKSVDNSLKILHKLYTQKNFNTLLDNIGSMKCSLELQPLKIFLEAEALRGLGDDESAIVKYSELLRKFPETEVSFKSRFPHFLLSMEAMGISKIDKLESLAMTLPTTWQRSAALKKLSGMLGISMRRKSKLVLHSMRESYSGSAFYSNSDIAKDIVKEIFQNPGLWMFSSNEWSEVLRTAAKEGELSLVKKKQANLSKLIKPWVRDYFTIFDAMSLAKRNNIEKSLKILNQMLVKKLSHKSLMSVVYKAKGDILYFAKRYKEAIYCYQKVIAKPISAEDKRAAEYRLMRSLFGLRRDAETLVWVNKLIKSRNCEPVLPSQLYDMGLDRYDNGDKSSAILYFMKLYQRFPEHYRADDALGYSVMALGKATNKGKVLFKTLKKKYPNSFFINWIDPAYKSVKFPINNRVKYSIPQKYQIRVKSWKKLWQSPFVGFAREEVRKLTDKNPKNLSFYKVAIEIAQKADDFNRLTAYGERMLRQLILSGKNGSDMPDWAWRAFYPRAFWGKVEKESKRFAISPYWVLSIMREESHFNIQTLSRSNAISLMQILPTTGKWIGQKLGTKKFRTKMLWDPATNIRFGSWYLRFLSDMFEGNLFLASASYNGGQGNIKRKVEEGPYKHLPVIERLDRVPMGETRDYFKKVLGSYWSYLRLYN